MFTPAQNAAIKAEILADQALAAQPNTNAGNTVIAAALNAAASPDFYAWRSSVSTSDLYDAITWANLTPAMASDGTALFTNRALVCQAKQINLQIILQGRESVNPSKASIRAGLQDSLTNIPAGASGQNIAAGWAAMQPLLYRKATRLEKILAAGTGTTGSPALMGFEGSISPDDIEAARVS